MTPRLLAVALLLLAVGCEPSETPARPTLGQGPYYGPKPWHWVIPTPVATSPVAERGCWFYMDETGSHCFPTPTPNAAFVLNDDLAESWAAQGLDCLRNDGQIVPCRSLVPTRTPVPFYHHISFGKVTP